MFTKSDSDIELEKLINKQKDSLRQSFKDNFSTQQNTLDLFVKAINHADFNDFKDTRIIWNIAGFINIVSYDLKIIGQDLTFAENEWQKRYYARQACLIIYESLNDFFDLMGKDFKTLIDKKVNDKSIADNLNSIRKDLNKYKDANFQTLKQIRNVSIAHKDNDIIKQIEIIQNINWSDTLTLITQFDKILNDLGKLFQNLINIGLVDFKELTNNKH
jgi:hypothetical protein